ncbi:MAG: hypothetical protein IKP03_01640 [Fibrobacter sp.]|nr:hypothetical protein [Fibrobacter sp.]MBR4679802.1 hypothetical protein [Fibrobacter sp.]
MRKMQFAACHPERRTVGSKSKDLLWIFVCALVIALVACGDDSGTSANDGDGGSEATMTSSSSSSSQKKDSSSSKKVESSSSQKITSSSSVKTVSSSSSVVLSSSEGSSSSKQSSSSKKVESSSSQKIVSSSSVAPASSSSKKVSSSSEYVPYDHSTCLAWNWNIEKDVYKQFTDPRNGRSYYYYTAVSSKTGRTVTVMAENLNIGEMVLGENDQNDDTKIERYCYNNDTTNCDKYGGLYQWAEMMQLPSRCNTESCSDWIERDHQGICPDGWRLFTWDDFEIIRDYNDQYGDGVKGLRSQCFQGKNTSGFSLIGAGRRTIDGDFEGLNESIYWVYPQEHEYGVAEYAYAAFVLSGVNDNTGIAQNRRAEKIGGRAVRCTKIE